MLKLIKKAVETRINPNCPDLYSCVCCTIYCSFLQDIELDPSPKITFNIQELATKVGDIFIAEIGAENIDVYKAVDVYTKITHLQGNPTFFLKTLIEKFNYV